MYSLKNGQIE